MDNKKVYQIQINGIEQSIDAVEALNAKLNELDTKIKKLEERKVTVNTSASSNISREITSALSEEAAKQKEINKLKQEGITLDAKIAAAQEEVYKQVDATKQLYKETIADQKAIAAQERLTADAYSKTMQGMKNKLADLKSVINTTDLGDSDQIKKMTKEANELATKLKEMEEAYGQFGRNVGNYKSAFDDVKKVTVQVGNTTREFNSVRDASRQLTQELKAMAIAGKEDTEEYKELAEAVHNFEMASKRAESAVNDLKASSKGMDDILDTFESLGYLASTTQGLSALFGFDNTSIERSIQKLVALQNVLQGIEKLRLKINAGDAGLIGDLFKGGNQAVDSFVSKLTGAKIGINGLTKGSKAATIAVRGLSLALKGLGIGLAMFAISKLIDGLSKLGDEMNSTEKVTNRLDEALKDLNKSFEERNQTLMSSYLKNGISDEQFLTNLYQNQSEYLNEQIYLLKERAALMNKANEGGFFTFDLFDSFTKGGNFTGDMMGGSQTVSSYSFVSDLLPMLKMTVNNIKEVEEEWRKCNEAIKEGEDYFTKWGDGINDFVNSFFTTVSDTERVMIGLGNIDISNYIGSFAKVNEEFSKGIITAEEYAKEIGKLKTQLNSSDVLRSVVANLEKYIPDEEVRKAINNIISDIVRLDDAFNMTSPAQIRHWAQVRIDGMKEGSAKMKAQLDADEKYEISQYGRTEEQIKLIRQKYARKRIDELKKYNDQEKNKAKQHARELEAVEKELNSLRIQNMAEGLNKQLAQLEEERRQKLAKANQDGVKVGELTTEINKLYDKKVLDAKEKWSYQIEQVYTNMWNKIYQINHQNAQMNFEDQLKQLELEYKTLQDTAAKNSGSALEGYSSQGFSITKTKKRRAEEGSTDSSDYKYDVLIEKDIDYTKRLKEEFKKRTEDRKAYYAETERLTIEELDKQYSIEKEKADENRNNELRTLVNSYDAQDHELEEHLKKGEITQAQYNEATKRLAEERAEQETQIQNKYRTESEKREREHREKIANAQKESNDEMLNNYQSMMDKLNNIDSSKVLTNGIGILDIVGTKRRNKELIDAYKQLSDSLAFEIKKLENRLKNEDITAEQRKQIQRLIEQYNLLQAQIGGRLTSIQADTKEAISKSLVEFNDYVQGIGSSLNTVLSSLSEIESNKYDQLIDDQEKYIDKYSDLLDKQKDKTQEYADAVKNIEDELSTARGDRRQQLIDSLNAEMAAQRASLAQEKKIEKEKEKAERKKAELEYQQAIAKKKMDESQALINAAMAVSMAAVNKWPLPAVPMMALAAAAGAAQYAAVRSQNIPKPSYGDGGVILGKSHAQGGVKVLGGMAEVEGGEYITNKVTTSRNVELLEYINSRKKRINLDDLIEFYGAPVRKNIQTVRTKFADGGQIPTLRSDITINDRLINAMEDYSNRPVQVAVVDIIDRQAAVNNVKVLAGLDS